MSKKLFDRNVPGTLFKPTFRREASQASAYAKKPDNVEYQYDQWKDTNLYSTASYRYGDKPYYVSNQQARIDYSKFENHTFFGSAKLKLQNFKDKAIKLEGLYKELSDSLSIESTAKTIERRKDLFKSINVDMKKKSFFIS